MSCHSSRRRGGAATSGCWLWLILTLSAILLEAGCQPAPSAPVEQALAGTQPYEIEVVGSEDRWLVRYPGQPEPVETSGEELLGLQLHVPAQRLIRLALHSTDYIYTLELPERQLKEIAVPKLVFYLEFQSGLPSRSPLVGDHLCRGVVEELQGTLIVEPPGDLARWLRSQTPRPSTDAGRAVPPAASRPPRDRQPPV